MACFTLLPAEGGRAKKAHLLRLYDTEHHISGLISRWIYAPLAIEFSLIFGLAHMVNIARAARCKTADALAIGRALMSRPKLLCIDEPSTGVVPLTPLPSLSLYKQGHGAPKDV